MSDAATQQPSVPQPAVAGVPSNAATQPMNASDIPAPEKINGLPSIEDIAKQFKGKSLRTDFYTKPEAEPKTESKAKVVEPEPVAEVAEEAITEPEVAPPVETSAEEPVVEEPVTNNDPKSKQFAALSRKERDLKTKTDQHAQTVRQTEARLQEMEQRLAGRLADLEKRESQFSTATRPLDLLKARGFTYEDATRDAVGGYVPKEPDPLDTRLNPIAQELAELKKALAAQQAEAETDKNQRNLNTVNMNITKTLTENPERYEFVNALGEQKVDIVRQTMVEWYNANGTYLPYDEACDHVEEFYTKQYELLTKTSKAGKGTAKPTQPAPTQQTQPKPAKTPAKTLTTSMPSSGKSATNVDDMPKRDALAHLAKQLKFL